MKPCRICGSSDRHPSGKCKTCHKQRNDQWRKNNPEKARAAIKIWKEKNPVKVAEDRAKWASNNPEKISAAVRRYRNKNPNGAKRASNKWKKSNLEKCRVINNNRRDKTKGRLSPGIVGMLFAKQGGICPACGLLLNKDFHIDHKVPLSKGGLNVDTNVQLLHAVCNMKKGSKLLT